MYFLTNIKCLENVSVVHYSYYLWPLVLFCAFYLCLIRVHRLHIVSMTHQLRSHSWSLHNLPKFLFGIPFNIDLPAMWETQFQSLGQEDPLEKEMATHSSILAWRIPWIEEPGRLQSMGSQRIRHNWATSLSL